MTDWVFGSVIKGQGKRGEYHNNIVGTLCTVQEGKEYVYKVSRLPSWRPFWECLVSHTLATRARSVKHFARVLDVCVLDFELDQDGHTLPHSQALSHGVQYKSAVQPPAGTFSNRDGGGAAVKHHQVTGGVQQLGNIPLRFLFESSSTGIGRDNIVEGQAAEDASAVTPRPATAGTESRYCMIQKLLFGCTLARQIRCGCSQEYLVGALCQLLAALDCVQQAVQFTHFDIHPNNVIMVPEKSFGSNKQVFYYYDYSTLVTSTTSVASDDDVWGTTVFDSGGASPPLLVPCYGYRAKIIDYEYAHVDAVEEKPFDSRLDLVGRGYCPTTFDPTFDVLRMVLSSLSHFCTVQPTKHTLLDGLLKQLMQRANSCLVDSPFFVSDIGLTEDQGDRVRLVVAELAREEKLVQVCKLVEHNYYHFVGLLLHQKTLPLQDVLHVGSVIEQAAHYPSNTTGDAFRDHCKTVVDFFKLVLQWRLPGEQQQSVGGNTVGIHPAAASSLSTTAIAHGKNNNSTQGTTNRVTQCHNKLFGYLNGGKDPRLLADQTESWRTKFFFLLKLTTDTLQSLYAVQLAKVAKQRTPLSQCRHFHPAIVINFLTKHVPLEKTIQPDDVVYVCRRGEKRLKYTVRDICKGGSSQQAAAEEQQLQTLADFNSDCDVLRRGRVMQQQMLRMSNQTQKT